MKHSTWIKPTQIAHSSGDPDQRLLDTQTTTIRLHTYRSAVEDVEEFTAVVDGESRLPSCCPTQARPAPGRENNGDIGVVRTLTASEDDEDTAVPAASIRHLPSPLLEGQWEK